jgi:hypothetical protein
MQSIWTLDVQYYHHLDLDGFGYDKAKRGLEMDWVTLGWTLTGCVLDLDCDPVPGLVIDSINKQNGCI